MIERRYPIQTVLANRKMFAGGGVVSPQQTAAPVQPSMGILSSSSPLMEAVAADAVNPDGGRTMVEAAEFNEGGAVRGYHHGGAHFLGRSGWPSLAYSPMRRARPPVVSIPIPPNVPQPTTQGQGGSVPRPDQADDPYTSDEISTLTPIMDVNDPRVMGTQKWAQREGAGFTVMPDDRLGMSEEALLAETGSERLQRLFPVEFSSIGRQESKRDSTKGIRAGSSRVDAFLINLISKGKNIARGVVSEAGQDIEALAGAFLADAESKLPRGMFGDPDSLNWDMISRRRTVMEMIQRRPDLKDDIIAASKKVLNENENITAHIRSLEGDSTLGENDFAQAIATTISQDREFAPPDLTGADRSGPEDDLERTAFVREQFEDPTGPDQEEKPFADLFEGDVAKGLIAAEKAETVAEKAETAVKNAEETDTSAESAQGAELVGAEVETEDLSGAPGSEWKSVVALLASGLHDSVKGENPKKGVKDFVSDFNEVMPAFKGMSESEKGFAIMEAGLKIMAGQSPHALVNIAEGLKGLGPQFAKDAEEKRAWNRQVSLSAAKYALEADSKERTRELALAKEGRGLRTIVWTKDVYDPDGSLRGEKGTSGFITNEEIHSGAFDGAFEAGTELAVERIKKSAAATSSLLRKMIGQKGGPSDKFFTDSLKSYNESALKLSDYATQLALVDVSATINDQGNAVGLGAFVKRRVNDFYNIFNMDRPGDQIKSIGDLTDKDIDSLDVDAARKNRLKSIRSSYSFLDKLAETGRDSEKFYAQQEELANLLIKEILGEGSKNVSNIDRELAAEIVGLYRGLSTITGDSAIIADRLGRIRQRILKNYEAENNRLAATEGYFTDIVDRSKRSIVPTYFTPVRRSALGQVERALGQAGYNTARSTGGGPYTFSVDKSGKRTYRFKKDFKVRENR